MCRRPNILICGVLVVTLALGLFPATGAADTSLLVWYQFEGNADDSSDYGNDGVELGTPAYPVSIAGQGQAIDLDGSDNSVDVDYANIVTGDMSIAMWMMPRNMPYSSGYRSIFHGDAWNAGSIHGHLRSGTSMFNFDINSGPGVTSTTAAVSDEWYHVALTIDSGTAIIYVNGVPENTNSGGTATPYLGPLNIGAWQENSRFFDGLMDDFRIYDYPLSGNEVVAVRGLGTIYVPVTSPANLSDAEPVTQKKVNFLDYAALLEKWLNTEEWPN